MKDAGVVWTAHEEHIKPRKRNMLLQCKKVKLDDLAPGRSHLAIGSRVVMAGL